MSTGTVSKAVPTGHAGRGSHQLGRSTGTETRNGDGESSGRNRNQAKRGRNEKKLLALAAFENRGWMSPPAWSVLTGIYPVRSAYSYLKQTLWKWKLLERKLDARGLILYKLSAKGEQRLAWLRDRKGNK